MSDRPRQPAGVPTGGQFAASGHAEADAVVLEEVRHRPRVQPTKGVRYDVTYLRDPGDDEPYPVRISLVADAADPDGVWLRAEDGSAALRIDTITHFEPSAKALARRTIELSRELAQVRQQHRDQILDDIRAELAPSFAQVDRIEFVSEIESDYPVDVCAVGTGRDGQPKNMAIGGGHTWHTGPHMAVPDLLSEWPSVYATGESPERTYVLDLAQRRILPDDR
jgi:hypothetical protein